MKFWLKWVLATIVLLVGTALAHALAWADILFWKVGWIAKALAVPEAIILFPTTVIPIAPGSAMDGPWFFFPACLINIALWSLLLAWLWSILRKRNPANNTQGGMAIGVLVVFMVTVVVATYCMPVECPHCHNSNANGKGGCVVRQRGETCREGYYPRHDNKNNCGWCNRSGSMMMFSAMLD